jgi:hypothetical protein
MRGKALDPDGMAPTSTSNIYKVFGNIPMLWMGRWIQYLGNTTIILVGQDFRELSKFLGHSLATNDVMVNWLRPQTHMECFPHPLQT